MLGLNGLFKFEGHAGRCGVRAVIAGVHERIADELEDLWRCLVKDGRGEARDSVLYLGAGPVGLRDRLADGLAVDRKWGAELAGDGYRVPGCA
jgi:hypothetical protein